MKRWFGMLLIAASMIGAGCALTQTESAVSILDVFNATAYAQTETVVDTAPPMATESIFSRAFRGGFVVFTVLLILIVMSVVNWGLLFSKWMYLRRIDGQNANFIKSFWESRSLNDLNSRLSDYPYSPVREVFRTGYAELVRASQLREQVHAQDLALTVAVDNLTRSLGKAKNTERRSLERYLPILAIGASAAPFIGLFGTVWGIMNSFEGIARSGSASLAAVAPGISEALIATAFGLAAAIPAAIGYNICNNKIRMHASTLDGFGADFMNIVERYLVTDRPKASSSNMVNTVSATSSAPERIG
jgi:biopolymer transport protein TolQ